MKYTIEMTSTRHRRVRYLKAHRSKTLSRGGHAIHLGEQIISTPYANHARKFATEAAATAWIEEHAHKFAWVFTVKAVELEEVAS